MLRYCRLDSCRMAFLMAIFGAFLATSMPGSANAGVISKVYSFTEPRTEQWEGYIRVTMPGLTSYGEPGEPVLPGQEVVLLVPFGEEIDHIEIIPGSRVDLPGAYLVEPGQPQAPLSLGMELERVQPAPAIYTSSSPFPGRLYWRLPTQTFRGYRLCFLALSPVEYIPGSGTLSYYEDLEVRAITVSSSEARETTQRMLRPSAETVSRVVSLIDNPEDLNSYPSVRIGQTSVSTLLDQSEAWDYVIITNDELSAQFQTLADFKTRRGIKTTLALVGDILTAYQGADSQDEIRQFILDAYLNWGVEYVLLAGDDEIIPHRGLYAAAYGTVDYDIAADLYYGALDGNWNDDGDDRWGESGEADLMAEVFVGRAAVDSEEEAANFIAKTISYQSTPVVDECLEALMVGELLWDDPTFGGDYKDEVKDGSSNHGYTTVGFPSRFNVNTLYDRDLGSWSKYTLIDMMNAGLSLVNHLGHCSNTYGLRLYNPDVPLLTSDGVEHSYFIIYTQGCYCNSFDNRTSGGGYTSDAISEVFTTSPYGVVAFVGNTRYGWGMHSSTNGSSQYFDRQFFDAIFGEGIFNLGKANEDSKIDNIWAINYGANRWCYYQLCLLGDPELHVWTDIPRTLLVEHLPICPLGTTEFSVSVSDDRGPLEDALVCLYKDDDVYETTETDALGEAFIELDPVPSVLGSLWVTVTAHDHLSYEVAIPVVVPATLSFEPDSIMVEQPTPVDFAVFDTLGLGMEDVELTVSGWGVSGAVDTTDAFGMATILLDAPYDEVLTVSGRRLGDAYDLFREELSVFGGVVFGEANLSAQVSQIGLSDSLIYNYWGTVMGSCDLDGFTLYLEGCGLDTSVVAVGAEAALEVVPTTQGKVQGAVAKSGYQVYREEIPVVHYAGISGQVTLFGAQENVGAVVTAVGTDQSSYSDTTSADGRFLIPGLEDGTYSVIAAKEGYPDSTVGQVEVEHGRMTGGLEFTLFPYHVLFQADFDFDPQGFTVQQGEWEWGTPTSGPESAHSGSNVWATSLESNYENSSDSRLESPVLDLTFCNRARLEFWQWYSFEGSHVNYDGGNVKVSTDGGPFQVVTPEGGYDGTISNENVGIPGEEGFSLPEVGNFWHKVVFDLSQFAGHEVVIRWHFGSDFVVHSYPGWYIDDVRVYFAHYFVPVHDDGASAIKPVAFALLPNYPNPFNPTTEIRYDLPADCWVRLEIFNILGQRVRTLVDENQRSGHWRATWDGRDGRGQELASGVYLFRISAGDFTQTRRMAMVR